METKKYIVSLLLFSLLILSAKANEPIKYGVVAGMNLSTMSTSATNNKIGFHLGAKAEVPITAHFYLDGSLLFSMKGYKSDSFIDVDQNKVDITQKNYYLELPIHIGYKLNIHENYSVFLNGGPYAGLGLFGKLKNKTNVSSTSRDLYKSGYGDRRFDWGLGLKAGIEFQQKLQVLVGYDWGLMNIKKNRNDYKNRNLMFSFAYLF